MFVYIIYGLLPEIKDMMMMMTIEQYHFQGQKVKGLGHQAALLTAVLARQAAAAVGVGTCWP